MHDTGIGSHPNCHAQKEDPHLCGGGQAAEKERCLVIKQILPAAAAVKNQRAALITGEQQKYACHQREEILQKLRLCTPKPAQADQSEHHIHRGDASQEKLGAEAALFPFCIPWRWALARLALPRYRRQRMC